MRYQIKSKDDHPKERETLICIQMRKISDLRGSKSNLSRRALWSGPSMTDTFLFAKYDITRADAVFERCVCVCVCEKGRVERERERVFSQLSAAEAWRGEIKQSWRGNHSAPNQIYLRVPLRRIDVLSVAEDFHPLHRDTETINTKVSGAFLIVPPCVSVWPCEKTSVRAASVPTSHAPVRDSRGLVSAQQIFYYFMIAKCQTSASVSRDEVDGNCFNAVPLGHFCPANNQFP